MKVGSARVETESVEIGPNKFERVRSFLYLCIEVNALKDVSQEINRRTAAANQCFFGLKKISEAYSSLTRQR